MRSVFPARPYSSTEMGSLGPGSCMLIRQFRFPDQYTKDEKHLFVDHDRLLDHDYDRVSVCFKKHTGTEECGLGDWARRSSDAAILNLLKELFGVEDDQWTGFRILGSVHQGNGFPVWTLELFAKDPKSSTKVYTGCDRRERCTEDS